ncbi:UNVERIFIED_CONTAM: hypothetical protein HHA_248540 [Hammondia hammondi]|eukprot:XP_008883871.1 hypothetical protein HHA_248540 [Hammondia hammondi]
MERRLSRTLAALTSASSATEQRRHLQEIADLLGDDALFSSVDLHAPELWGDLAGSLLAAARQQFSRAFPSPTVSRIGKPRRKPSALCPNDAIAIQKIFNAIETRSTLSSSCSDYAALSSSRSSWRDGASEPSTDSGWGSESASASSCVTAHVELNPHDGGRGCRTEGGRGHRGDADDFFASFASSSSSAEALRPNRHEIGRRSKHTRERHARPVCSCGSRLTPVAADVVKELVLLLLACGRKRRATAADGGECLRPTSGRLQLLQRASQSSETRKRGGSREGEPAGDRGWRLEEGDFQRGGKGASLHCREAEKRSEEANEDAWNAAAEKWEGCFLSILQQLVKNENYLRVLPSHLVKALLSRLLSLSFSSTHKCLCIALSLFASPSVSRSLSPLARSAVCSLLRTLEGLLHPRRLLPVSGFLASSAVLALSPFSPEDGRVAAGALACLLQLVSRFPFLFRERLFFLTTRTEAASRSSLSSTSASSGVSSLSSSSSSSATAAPSPATDTLPREVCGPESRRGSAQAPLRVSDDCVQLSDGQRYEGESTWHSSSRLGTRNVSFIQLGRVQAPESATERHPLQGVWDDADAWRPGKPKRDDWREKVINECDCSGNPEDETRHENAEVREPLVVDILLGLLQDDVWVHLDEAAKWNVIWLVRWTLMLARGTTGRAVLPSFIGDTECMGRLFGALLRRLPQYFSSLRAPNVDDAHALAASVRQVSIEEICHTTCGVRFLQILETFPGPDEDVISTRQGSGGIWYMRVVLLDLLLQTIWEAAHHHPGLLGFARSSFFFSSLHAASGSSSLSSSASSFQPASWGSGCPSSRLRRGRGTGMWESLDEEVERSEKNACRGVKRQRGEGTAEGASPSEATKRGREPSYIRNALSNAAKRPLAFLPTSRHGDEDSDEGEGMQGLLKEERSAPGNNSATQTKGDVNNVESRAREERNPLRVRRKRRSAKQVAIAYILSKVEGANSDVQRQMWSLLVVRLCESAGAAFASSSSLGLLLPLLRVLAERYVRALKSLSSLAVSSGRRRASASSLVGHFVALAQALSSLLLLPLYPRLGLNGAMTSEGPADTREETPIGEAAKKTSAIVDAHKWRLGDRKGNTAWGEKGDHERDEARSRVRDTCDTASRAASASPSASPRSLCISGRREEPAMSLEVFKSGEEGDPSVARDGTESDDNGSDEETSSAWQIPVLSSQLLNHAAIISTLKCGDMGGTRLETVPSLVALAASSSSCSASSLPVSLLLASLSHASAVLDSLVQQQMQMTTTDSLASGDSSSLTFSPQFVFASFSRVLQLLLLLLPRAFTRAAVPLLLAPPFLPSSSTLASHSAALPGRHTPSEVDPGRPGFRSSRVFSSALFPPSPWLLELFSVLVLRHPSLISPACTDALLRYLLPHVLSPDPKGAGRRRLDAEKTRRPSKNGRIKNPQEEASLAEEAGLTEHPMARLWMPYAFARPLPSSSAARACAAWASLASLSLWALFPLLLRNMAGSGNMEDPDSAPLQSVHIPSATSSPLFARYGPTSTLSGPLPRTSVGAPSPGSSPRSLQDSHSVSQAKNPKLSLTRFCELVYCRSACPSASPLLLSPGTADHRAARAPHSPCSTVSRSPSSSASAAAANDDSTETSKPMSICRGPREAPAPARTLFLSLECPKWSDAASAHPLSRSVHLPHPAAIYRDRYQICQSLFVLLRLSEVSSLSSLLFHSSQGASRPVASAPFAAAAEGVPFESSVGALASSASWCWQTESRFNDISSLFLFLPLPLVPSLSCPSPLVLLRTSRPSSVATPKGRPSDPGCASRSAGLRHVGWHVVAQKKIEGPENSLGNDLYSAAVVGLPLATETASLSSRFPERVISIFYSSHVESTLEFLSLFHVQAGGRCHSRRGTHTQEFSPRSCCVALPSRSTCPNAALFASASSVASASLDTRKPPWETTRLLSSVSLSVAVAAASRFLRSLRIASLVLPAELWVAPLPRRRPGDLRPSPPSRTDPSHDVAMFTAFKSKWKTRRPTEGALSDSASPAASRVSSSSGSDGSGDRECHRRVRKVCPVGEKDAQRLSASLSGMTRRVAAERRPRERLLWRPLEPCAAGCATWLAVECLLGLFLRSLHPQYTSRVSGGFFPSVASAGEVPCVLESKRKCQQHRRIEARRPHEKNESRRNGILGRDRDVCNSETLSRSDKLDEDKDETSARRSADSDHDSASHQPTGKQKALDASGNLLVESQQQREMPGDRGRGRKNQDELPDSSPDASHVEALWKLWTETFVILQSQGLPSQPVCFACDLAHAADAVPVERRNHVEGMCFVAEKAQKAKDGEAGRETETQEREPFRVHSGEQAGGLVGDRQEKGPRRNSGASSFPSAKSGVNAAESPRVAMHGGDRRDVRRSEWSPCDGAKDTGSRAFGVERDSRRETQPMALESSGSWGTVANPEVAATGIVAYWRLYSFSSSPRLTCMHLQLLASLVVLTVSRSVPARTPLERSSRRREALSLSLSPFVLNSWRLHEAFQGQWTEDTEDEEHARVADSVGGRWSRSDDEVPEVCREFSVPSSFWSGNSDPQRRRLRKAVFAEGDTEMDAEKNGDVFESSQDALVPSTFTLMRLLLASLSVFSVFSSASDSCFCPCSVRLPVAITRFTDRSEKEEVSPLDSFRCRHDTRACTTHGKAFGPGNPVKERDLCMQDPGEDRQDNMQASVEFFCEDLSETKNHPATYGVSDKVAGISVSSFAPLSRTDSDDPAPLRHRPLWAVCVELLHALVAGASASSFIHLEAATRGSEPTSSRRTSWDSITATDGDVHMSWDGCRSSLLASETDAGERQREGVSHEQPQGESQELRYGCEFLVRPVSSFSSSPSRSPATLEDLWARGGGPAIFWHFFDCMHIEDPQARRLSKGEGDAFIVRDEARKRSISLLDAAASVIAMEAPLAIVQPVSAGGGRMRWKSEVES